MASFRARALTDVFFLTNIKSSAFNFFAKLTEVQDQHKNSLMSNSQKSKKRWKILLKFKFINWRLQVGFGTFFFWPLAEIPLTHLQRLSAIHYLLAYCWFETICTLLLTWNHSDLHFTALGKGRGGGQGSEDEKASLFCKNLSPVKCRENESGGLVRSWTMSRCVHWCLAIR